MALSKEKVSLPDDLVLNILSRLPVKSLKRFSFLRKSWVNLLEDPHFINMYYKNLTSKTRDSWLLLKQQISNTFKSDLYLLSGESYKNRVKIDLPSPFQEDNGNIIIVGSCINGTICLHQGFMLDTNNSMKVLLWTPKTNEFKVIPPCLTVVPELEFHITITGFGYDHVTDDYKIIRNVVYYDYNDNIEENPHIRGEFWQIYSVKNNCWRILDLEMRFGVLPVGVCDAVYLNGVCHWLAFRRHYQEPSEMEALLVSFDMSSETFVTTLADQLIGHNFRERCLVVLKESVAVISMFPEKNCFEVSILGEVGVKESWVKLFTVGLLDSVEYPIGVGKNGDIFFSKNDNKLVWYDFSSKMITEIGIKGDPFLCETVML